jgi:mannosylglycerate hydrolase
MGNNNKSVFHIISNTHWDREWRFPFQRNRQMLVDMIDAVLEILESEPDYRAFHLDSQSIVLKDYLEIKPQNKERIIKLTKENRLLHGPWYILPEEFQVGGENLVRNLLIGHKVSNKYGGASKIGYSPFSWGQISQLPQLYKEFNIDLIMFYRGINSIDSPKAEFLWEGADGTQMISSRFSTMPRYNFYFYIYRPAVHNEGFYDVEYKWNKGGTPFHFADKMQHNEDYFIISPHQEYYPENIQPMVEKLFRTRLTTSLQHTKYGWKVMIPQAQTDLL